MAILSERAAGALVALAQGPAGLRLLELSHAIGAPLSSTQRTTEALVRDGLAVRRGPGRPRYELTPEVPREALLRLAEWRVGPKRAERIRQAANAALGERRGQATRVHPIGHRARPWLHGGTVEHEAGPLSERVASLLPLICERLVRRFHPLRIVVFGSQARGNATDASDLDLLVVVPNGTAAKAVLTEMYESLADLPIGKDIVLATPSQIERYGTLVGAILKPALEEGVAIYERR